MLKHLKTPVQIAMFKFLAKELDATASFKKTSPDLAPGEHKVDELVTLRVQAVLNREKDGEMKASVSIPYTTVIALLLEKCGVVGAHAERMFMEAMREALTSDAVAKALLEAKSKNVDAMEERFKNAMAALPKIHKKGSIKLSGVMEDVVDDGR